MEMLFQRKASVHGDKSYISVPLGTSHDSALEHVDRGQPTSHGLCIHLPQHVLECPALQDYYANVIFAAQVRLSDDNYHSVVG